MAYHDGESIYIPQTSNPNWDDFKREAQKTGLTLSKFIYFAGKEKLERKTWNTLLDYLSFIFLVTILVLILIMVVYL